MKAIYPKTYAVYLGKGERDKEKTYGKEEVYRFQTDDGTIIEQKHFSRSGGTPTRLKREWYRLCREIGYRKALVEYNIMPVGTRVKLYFKPGRWCYRHMGE